jgi:5-(carboxyamino)imidazole ribonucleotide mutase
MPSGIPVATVAIGNGRNAGLLAARIVGSADAAVRRRIEKLSARMAAQSRAKNRKLKSKRL